MPRYLDPTVDLVFKKLFGEKSHKAVTIDFLNNILELKPGHYIVDLDFNDTFNRKDSDEDKLSVVDVRCTDQTGKTYIVEMQADIEVDFKERSQYYVACELSSQLDEKHPYADIMPVILVAVLNFNLFGHNRCLTHHLITDVHDHKSYLRHMAFHFVELKKFEKSQNQLTNIIDRWIFFLRYAEEYRGNPEKIAGGNKAIAKAFEIVDQANWSKKDLMMFNRRIDALRRQRSRIADARLEGEKSGERRAALFIARNMLAKEMAADDIAAVTGLAVDVVKKLKKEKK